MATAAAVIKASYRLWIYKAQGRILGIEISN
jgi:hypothetical protein